LQELEARLARLEARAATPAPTPLASVPPIRIGEITDTPTPGSPIASAWSQEVTNRIMQRFATVAARDSQWPAATAGAGAVCVTLDTGTEWLSNGTAWRAARGGVVYAAMFSQPELSVAGGARDVLFGNYTPTAPVTISVSGTVYFGFAASTVGAQIDLVKLSDSSVIYTVTHLSAPTGVYGVAGVAATWLGTAGAESGFKIRTNTTVVAQYVNAVANMVVVAN
jgi:hypothetical protein